MAAAPLPETLRISDAKTASQMKMTARIGRMTSLDENML
jgi:hypothetical protein